MVLKMVMKKVVPQPSYVEFLDALPKTRMAYYKSQEKKVYETRKKKTAPSLQEVSQ